MKNLFKLLVMVAMVFTFATDLDAQDIKLSVQGTLKDANGAAVDDGPQDLIFRLYNTTSGGIHLWEESASVQVIGGVYSHNLGSVDPANNPLSPNDFSSTVYVGVTVNGTELSPRTELTYAPYTLYVGYAGNGTPAGGIVPYAGPTYTVPNGWMICDGRALSSTDYPALYNAIETSWGNGSAGTGATSATDFNLPDMRGMFMRGVDLGKGADPDRNARIASSAGGNTGDKVGSYQGDNFKSHNHTQQGTFTTSEDGEHSHSYMDEYIQINSSGFNAWNGGGGEGPKGESKTTGQAGDHHHTVTISGGTTSTGGNETRGKNVGVVYIIKI